MARNLHDVPLHDFYEKHPENPHGYVAEQSKTGVFGSELSNSGGYWRAVVAIAAKNARLAWAVLKYGEDFRLNPVAA